jgi:bifunctional non-homologous end joining protein LigD
VNAADPFGLLATEVRDRLPAEAPAIPDPMLATLTDDRFDDPDWVYERKLDGQRVLAMRVDGRATLRSRNDLDLDATYPELVDALSVPGPDLVVDGEVVAFDGPVTSFARLQRRMQLRDAAEARSSGVAVLADACERGWEGLIAKDATAPYTSGRSRRWSKLKCAHQQELVIGGFTAPQGSRTRFGALLVGHHEDGHLRYAGKVGTGYDRATLDRVGDLLEARVRQTSPFDDEVPERRATWVTPDLVAEIGFTEWTRDGRLRHPRFLGLRDDKDANDVVRERPT